MISDNHLWLSNSPRTHSSDMAAARSTWSPILYFCWASPGGASALTLKMKINKQSGAGMARVTSSERRFRLHVVMSLQGKWTSKLKWMQETLECALSVIPVDGRQTGVNPADWAVLEVICVYDSLSLSPPQPTLTHTAQCAIAWYLSTFGSFFYGIFNYVKYCSLSINFYLGYLY